MSEPVTPVELMAHADGELPAEDNARVERWLEAHAEAGEHLAAWEHTSLWLDEVQQRFEADAPDLTADVMARVRQESRVVALPRPSDVQHRSRWPRLAAYGAVIAAAAGAILVLASSLRDGRQAMDQSARAVPVTLPSAARASAAASTSALPEGSLARAPAPTPVDDGAVIESVEFGAPGGTVMMVPGADGDTPVVWLNDGDGEVL